MTPDHSARMAQHFETVQGRASRQKWLRKRADRAYRSWRLALVFCAACSAAIIAMLAGMAVLHLMTVTAGNLAAPAVAPW